MNERVESAHAGIGDFFDRARKRLTLEVPPALTDSNAEGARGDLDLNPQIWERAGVKATRPAAVLVPIIDRGEGYDEYRRVLEYLEFFQLDARDRFEIWLSRLGRYEGMIRARLRAKGLPEDLVYLTLIESGLSNTAVSRARAARG